VTVRLWEAALNSRVDSHAYKPDIDFLVLDGIPRNLGQAEIMDEHIDVLKVFHLSCPNREELARRLRKRALKDNRMDDASDEVIERRIATYEAETKPVLEFYGADRVVEIDATKQPIEVLSEIIHSIMKLDKWKETRELKV